MPARKGGISPQISNILHRLDIREIFGLYGWGQNKGWEDWVIGYAWVCIYLCVWGGGGGKRTVFTHFTGPKDRYKIRKNYTFPFLNQITGISIDELYWAIRTHKKCIIRCILKMARFFVDTSQKIWGYDLIKRNRSCFSMMGKRHKEVLVWTGRFDALPKTVSIVFKWILNNRTVIWKLKGSLTDKNSQSKGCTSDDFEKVIKTKLNLLQREVTTIINLQALR